MSDLTETEIIFQLRAKIKELEYDAQINTQSSFNVVKFFANRNL